MNARWKIAGIILVLMVAGNFAYATTVPRVLDAALPATMPLGYRESFSPSANAGATFVDVTRASGIDFKRYEWKDGDLPYPAVVGGGLAVGDVNGDGREDLYFPPGGPGIPAKMYVNDGSFRFHDVAAAAGLAAVGFGTGASFGDVDNDGAEDLVVAVDGTLREYRNRGDGTFEDVAEAAGLSLAGKCGDDACQPASVAWFDYDLDGLLDLYVVNNLDWRSPGLHTSGQDYASLVYFAPEQLSLLFHNKGNGTFEDVTAESDVANTGKGLGVVATDVNADGRPDVLTANDITQNAMYVNLGGGAFRNEARRAGVNEIKTSMGIVSGDVNGDGKLDVLVSNFRGHKLSLFVQGADGKFSYDTDSRGLGASWRGTGWGVALADYDLDGWLDAWHAVGRAVPLDPHRNDLNNLVFKDLVDDSQDELFRNLGNGSFAEVTATAGAFGDLNTTRALAAVDLDGDGDLDVVRVNVQGESAQVLRNDLAVPGTSLSLRLEGAHANRDAIGARVEATLPDGRVLVREVRASSGYQTGESHVLSIGLAGASSARVLVRWPGGAAEDFGVLAAGARTLREG